MMPPASPYDASSITVHRGLLAVRKRPGMYIGDLGVAGLRELIFEPISNTLDEYLAGHATALSIACDVDTGTWTVSDDGRGIPVAPIGEDGQSPLEKWMCHLHAGPHFGTPRIHVHAGRLGLGLAVLNALTVECIVEVERDGRRFRQDYARGLPTGFLHPIAPLGQRGTTFRFRSDPEIFGDATLSPADIRARLVELAALNRGLRITLQGEVLEMPDGLLSLAGQAAGGTLSRVRLIEGAEEGVSVRGVLVWRAGGPPLVVGYCNQSFTEGGSHVEGAQAALAGQPQSGLVLVLAVQVNDPRFAGRTRDRVDMPWIVPIIEAIIRDGLSPE